MGVVRLTYSVFCARKKAWFAASKTPARSLGHQDASVVELRGMIRSFKDSRTERLFHGEEVREFQAFARQAEKRLRILDAADTLRALQMLPSNRLEALKGDRRG